MYREPPRGRKKKTYLELHYPRWEGYFGSSLIWVELFCDPFAVTLWSFCRVILWSFCVPSPTFCFFMADVCTVWLPRCPALSIRHTVWYKNAALGSPWTCAACKGWASIHVRYVHDFYEDNWFSFSSQTLHTSRLEPFNFYTTQHPTEGWLDTEHALSYSLEPAMLCRVAVLLRMTCLHAINVLYTRM